VPFAPSKAKCKQLCSGSFGAWVFLIRKSIYKTCIYFLQQSEMFSTFRYPSSVEGQSSGFFISVPHTRLMQMSGKEVLNLTKASLWTSGAL